MKSKKKLLIALIELVLFLIVIYPSFDNRILVGIQTLIYCVLGLDAIKNFRLFFQENKN